MKRCFRFRCVLQSSLWACLLLFSMTIGEAYGKGNYDEGYLLSEFLSQQKNVKGKVTDSQGVSLPGVSITVKGEKNRGVATDFDGNYSIDVVPNDVLVFSYVGFTSQEISVGEKSQINVVLKEATQELDQVVVTALGIKRAEKALSYNTQTVEAKDLTTVKDANFINSLSGKVAGVTINRSSSGIGGAAKVVMRGAKSIEKSNNALYVIDGIPLFSTVGKEGNGRFQSAGSTEGIADINPEDIESMTVLTGASAAALYGSAAANGAILITTKKGKEGSISVDFSSNTEYMLPFVMPEFQNTYGNGGKIASWGKKLPDSAEKYHPRDFFVNSYAFTNSISLSGGTEKNQTYFSAASTNSNGLIPNNTYNRYNFTIRNTTSLLKDRFKIDASVSYILQDARNMINQGEYMNPLVSAYLLPRGDGFTKTKIFERYDPVSKIYDQVWGDFVKGAGSYSGDYGLQNPYWIAYRNLRDNDRERYMISLGLSYDIKTWSPVEKWDISARVRTDNANYKRTEKYYANSIPAGTDVSKNGFFGLAQGVERQTYLDILTNLTKRYSIEDIGNFSLTLNLGSSLQDTRLDGSVYKGPLRENGIPNLFNTFNIEQGAAKTKPGQEGWVEQTQSIFGSMEVGYNSYLYLTVTGRNDWASQLANSPNSSFFYPSVGMSAVITDMLSDNLKAKLNPVLSFAKLRASYSSVGSPFGRGLTSPSYSFNEDSKSWENVSHFPIGTLLPERTNSYEVGLASKFFANKLSFDITYYKTNTENQTIRSDISSSSGYSAIYLQTGNVENRGIELALGYNIESKDKKVSWGSFFTMGYNKNEIKSLAENYRNPITGAIESKEYLRKASLGSLNYTLKKGGSLGDVYTSQDLRRDSDGRIYVDSKGGLSIENFKEGELYKLGSVLPDYNLSWRNDFRFGKVGLGFMFSGRIGGVAISMTQAALDNYGVSKVSADARDNGGVEINGLKVDPKEYYETIGKNQLAQYYTYSATNFRLQEAYVSYNLPRKVTRGYMDLTLSVVGRNLLMLYNKAPFDPESVSSTGNYVQGLDYFMMPSLQSFGLNIKAKF